MRWTFDMIWSYINKIWFDLGKRIPGKIGVLCVSTAPQSSWKCVQIRLSHRPKVPLNFFWASSANIFTAAHALLGCICQMCSLAHWDEQTDDYNALVGARRMHSEAQKSDAVVCPLVAASRLLLHFPDAPNTNHDTHLLKHCGGT